MSSYRLSIRIDPVLAHTIQAHAQASGRRASEVVREVLEQHFNTRRPPLSCYELARKAKVIGCVKDAPRDLSTNPKYFEGFGGR
jgi:hypothetical protein